MIPTPQPELFPTGLGSAYHLRAARDKLRKKQANLTRNILALDTLIRITEARQ